MISAWTPTRHRRTKHDCSHHRRQWKRLIGLCGKAGEADIGWNRIYIATMRVWDKESEIHVACHREQRKELGFETIECPINLGGIQLSQDATVLLEDIPNLVANEMFEENGDVGRIIPVLQKLAGSCANLIMVTGNVFADGGEYAPETQKYMRLLSEVNAAAAALADCGVEVVYTIPVAFKGELPCA